MHHSNVMHYSKEKEVRSRIGTKCELPVPLLHRTQGLNQGESIVIQILTGQHLLYHQSLMPKYDIVVTTSTLYTDDSALVRSPMPRDLCEGYFVSDIIRSVCMILTMLLASQGERGWCQGPIPKEDQRDHRLDCSAIIVETHCPVAAVTQFCVALCR